MRQAIRLRGLGDKKGAQRQEDEAAAASAASEAYRAFGRKLAERLAAMQQVLQEHDALVEESRTSGSCEVEAPWVVAALELQHRCAISGNHRVGSG
jgi:acetate kinase